MKKLVILLTCLALTPIFSGCGGGVSRGVDPPKEELDALQKKSIEYHQKKKKK